MPGSILQLPMLQLTVGTMFTYHAEMNGFTRVRDGQFVQTLKELIPLALLKESIGLGIGSCEAEPSVVHLWDQSPHADTQGKLGKSPLS